MKDHKNFQEELNKKKQRATNEVKIKYDIYTPEDRDPQPKSIDEIEY